MGKRQGLLFALATVALVVLATFYFTRTWLPPLKSDRAAIDHAIWLSLVVTGAVFILTNLTLAYLSWRYVDDGKTRAEYWHDSTRLEWSWTIVTALIMVIFLFKALSLWAEVTGEPPADSMLIEVTGQQFAWNVRYPGPDGMLGKTDHLLASQENPIGLDKADPHATDDVLLLNQLYLPLDRAVRVQIRSMDVIHSFFLPNFRVKQDAVPGMTVQIWFTPKETGDFEIACAEHCGLGHYRMRGQVHVVPAGQFDKALVDAASQ
jgi:cytochrome c oxidase subunit 2